jgi:hypothetical protein
MDIRFIILIFLSPYYAMKPFNVLNLTLIFREEILLMVCYLVTCDGFVMNLIFEQYEAFLTFVLYIYIYIYIVFMSFILSFYW